MVVDRKNHDGSHSKSGAEVAAICYTLFETAKLARVDLHRYVLEATRRAITTRGVVTVPEDLTWSDSAQIPSRSVTTRPSRYRGGLPVD